MPRLLTWNVAGRVRDRLEAQLAVVGEQAWDAVCLQEVTPTTRDRWETALGACQITRRCGPSSSSWPARRPPRR